MIDDLPEDIKYFLLVAVAYPGLSEVAVELIKKYMPDIIITDEPGPEDGWD